MQAAISSLSPETIVTLSHLLAALPAHDLRVVATRLGVRTRRQQRKAEWLAALLAGWQQPDQAAAWVAA